ncbi:MIP family channel protein [Dysgonomonas macrotermitis]|uniref:Aquaporin Z n=1 Tax=Dysgonomonas macrotermitis TaxID=1346286 RepID=A0A1M5AU29_9BACT|nr:MIP family channel protein [Dysgonomonas macrotermitis]SHF33761.1 aquaporin Z [Dysgonomonas macrotermitis]
MKKYLAELIGTMVLVLMGCGSAVFAGAAQPFAAVGTLGVAFAFGLSVVAMVYTIGKISGCHINPAITLGMLVANKISAKDAGFYIVFQVIGAILGSAILYVLAKGSGSTTTLTGANGYTDLIPAFVAETVFTFIFLMVVFGSTSKGAANNFAGLAIGLALVLIHIVCIPITGTSVNPARSIGPALFQGGEALSQLWLFIVAPFLGAVIAAFVWKAIDTEPAEA